MVKLFTLKGRITRKQYVMTSLLVSLVGFVIAFGIGFASGMAGSGEDAGNGVAALISVAIAIVQSFLIVRRLHDIGKPGWHYWLFFVPLYNIYLSLVILFTPGTRGTNEYGADPSTA